MEIFDKNSTYKIWSKKDTAIKVAPQPQWPRKWIGISKYYLFIFRLENGLEHLVDSQKILKGTSGVFNSPKKWTKNGKNVPNFIYEER